MMVGLVVMTYCVILSYLKSLCYALRTTCFMSIGSVYGYGNKLSFTFIEKILTALGLSVFMVMVIIILKQKLMNSNQYSVATEYIKRLAFL